MHNFTFFGLICLVYSQVFPTFGQSQLDIKNLIADLFQEQNYRKNVRPLFDFSTIIDLEVTLSIARIIDVNEQEQKLVTSGYLTIDWFDDLLTWEPDEYGGADEILISQSEIWKPDLTLWNGFSKLSELGSDFMLVSINDYGWVKWNPSEIFETKCSIDVRYFPFDEQTCDIIISFWMMNSDWFDIATPSDGVLLNEYKQNGMWTITNTSAAVEYLSSSEYGVVFTVKLKRNSSFYIYNLILPIILLSILTIFTFTLPVDSGEKMGYIMTVFLSFAVFMITVSSELPKTSGSLLGSYMMFELAVSTFVVCFSAIQLRLHHRKEPVPQVIIRLLKLKYCKCRRMIKVLDSNGKGDTDFEQNQTIAWADVISKVDFILFWTIAILKVVGISIYMKLLTSK